MIELFEYRHKVISKDKVSILSMKMLLEDDELYAVKTQTSEWTPWPSVPYPDCLLGDDNSVIVTITFAYTPGGNTQMMNIIYG